jgi:hypothetical protein
MLLHAIKRMRTLHGEAFCLQSGAEAIFHGFLGSPAGLIGSDAEIAADDEVDGFHG